MLFTVHAKERVSCTLVDVVRQIIHLLNLPCRIQIFKCFFILMPFDKLCIFEYISFYTARNMKMTNMPDVTFTGRIKGYSSAVCHPTVTVTNRTAIKRCSFILVVSKCLACSFTSIFFHTNIQIIQQIIEYTLTRHTIVLSPCSEIRFQSIKSLLLILFWWLCCFIIWPLFQQHFILHVSVRFIEATKRRKQTQTWCKSLTN